ncbi:hypothetical protein B0H11DRAFT_2250554 [Mycena galericulata]|nr:hypothetical protein B0H11DRAFT_2250554 [Mycena galericulata]
MAQAKPSQSQAKAKGLALAWPEIFRGQAKAKKPKPKPGHHYRDVNSYFEVRRETIGAKPSFAICEIHMNIPDEVMTHPVIAKLSILCIDALIIGNDLCSYNVERAAMMATIGRLDGDEVRVIEKTGFQRTTPSFVQLHRFFLDASWVTLDDPWPLASSRLPLLGAFCATPIQSLVHPKLLQLYSNFDCPQFL